MIKKCEDYDIYLSVFLHFLLFSDIILVFCYKNNLSSLNN